MIYDFKTFLYLFSFNFNYNFIVSHLKFFFCKTLVGKLVLYFNDSMFTLLNSFCAIFEKVTTQTFSVNFKDFKLKIKMVNNTCAVMYKDPLTNGQFWSFDYFLE